ncbi:nucleotide exchange factor GrpE [candidate division NPL-UPA2 bacterium]|nr:nucleotide exchange factor GrpE [candidate division NPL-UPA2 bacterium]
METEETPLEDMEEIDAKVEESDGQEESLSCKINDLEDKVSKGFRDITERISNLSILFEEKISEDTTKEMLFKNLHSDLTRYREDFLFKNILKKVFMDIIRLFDRVDGLTELAGKEDIDKDSLIDHIKSFRKEILYILKKQEVSLLEKKLDRFDEDFQEAIDAKLVTSSEEDQRIVEVIKKGFTYQGRIFRPEQVIVGRYQQPKKEVEENG